jgi:hypothetical protein
MARDEQAIENEIQSKGLNAPRLSPAMIDAAIVGEDYHVFPGTTMTVCALKLKNGFLVIGESAAASPENFDKEIGRKIARDNARNKIWALEGYLLRNQLYYGDHPSVGSQIIKGAKA